ncbi:hypothetical protein LXJ15735_27560 [Lacrimispora xylanolytica]
MDKILELLMSNPDLIMPVVKEYIEKYKPMVYSLVQEMVEVYKDYSNNTDFPAVVAKTKKNMYDAYVGVGFTEDQSLALMINDNIQLMKNITQVSTRSNKATNKSVKVNSFR